MVCIIVKLLNCYVVYYAEYYSASFSFPFIYIAGYVVSGEEGKEVWTGEGTWVCAGGT